MEFRKEFRFHERAAIHKYGIPVALSGLARAGDPTQGSAPPPSTLGYIPAAASRLKVFAIFSDQVPDIEKRISDR